MKIVVPLALFVLSVMVLFMVWNGATQELRDFVKDMAGGAVLVVIAAICVGSLIMLGINLIEALS